jgi:WD40 repeat protein
MSFIAGCNQMPHDGDNVASVSFSPDSQTLVIGYEKCLLKLVDLKTGDELREFNGKFPKGLHQLTETAISPDGKTLACGFAGRFDDTINTWDIVTGKIKRIIPQAAQSIAFSPDGKFLADGGAEWKNENWSVATLLWDRRTGKLKQTLRRPMEGNVRSIAFTSDGQTLVAANDIENSKTQMLTMDAVVSAWNIKSGKMLWSSKEPITLMSLVACSPTKNIVANVCGDTVKLRNARTGKVFRTLNAAAKSSESPPLTALAFSPDGAVLAIGSQLGDITLWNVQTGTFLRSLNNHVGSVTSIKYSPDGKLIASGSEDHTVNLWDTQTWKVLRSIGKKYRYQKNPFS